MYCWAISAASFSAEVAAASRELAPRWKPVNRFRFALSPNDELSVGAPDCTVPNWLTRWLLLLEALPLTR